MAEAAADRGLPEGRTQESQPAEEIDADGPGAVRPGRLGLRRKEEAGGADLS